MTKHISITTSWASFSEISKKLFQEKKKEFNIENMIARAEKFVWILTDQILASTIPYLTQTIERGTEFRLLMPKNYMPSKDVRELVSNPIFEKASRAKKLENRFLGKIDVFLCLSEKEVASLAFPKLDGRLD